MFRLKCITLYKGTEKKDYHFSDNAYVYGHNNVGKTALTKVIDYALGSSERLSHAGLDNIDAVGVYLVNDKTELWGKRTVTGEYFYKRTESSEYTLISLDTYKEYISELITDAPDEKAVKVYQKVFDENPTYRSFTFLNFVDEIGQGDLGAIFTRGKEIRHLVRIRNIMDFFFNYENIEKLYEKRMELDAVEFELRQYNDKMNQYTHSVGRVNRLFTELGLSYSDDMQDNYKTFEDFSDDFSRKISRPSDDLVYLTKASHSLAEELKLYSYLENQSQEAGNRKARTERLLSTLHSIIAENVEYAEDVSVITGAIEEIKQDRLILSLADYEVSIAKVRERKKSIDARIALLKSQAVELDYDKTLKMIALLEDHFKIINSAVDISRGSLLTEQAKTLRKELKDIKNNYSQKGIKDFNNRLTQMYLENDITGVPYLNDDRNEEQFSLAFDPFSQVLVAKHKEGEAVVSYTPGSMARHNHLQLLVYLCMLEYLHERFTSFIYLPILIIDSADQPMEESSFEEIYPSLIETAKKIGVQTIFVSKARPKTVNDTDLIDITTGLNPFHLQSGEITTNENEIEL